MTCEQAQQDVMLVQYGELPDEEQLSLERHLAGCEACRREWNALLAMAEDLALLPVVEPAPNLLAASRMRLDEALDAMPARSAAQRLIGNAWRWLGFVQGAPALATLLLGVGFLGGNYLASYKAADAARHRVQAVAFSNRADSAIANVVGIVPTPNSDLVQVKYNRLVPETLQGSLDDPQIRQLLMLGARLGSDQDVQAKSVGLIAEECRAGHRCDSVDGDNAGIRSVLLSSLRNDRSPAVRLQALAGLQPYVAQDQRVRNAVLDAVMHDRSADVRSQAIAMLEPVGADSSVRQVLQTVSTDDSNPAIRNASYQALQGTADIE